MTSRPSNAAPILAALAIVLLPLGAYVAGYFWLGERRDWYWKDGIAFTERKFPQRWLAMIYQPAGRVEAWLGGVDVKIPLPE